MMIGKEEIMKTIARVLVFGALLSIVSAYALTVAYTTKGPMWYSWGIVPSESELRKNIAELIGKMSFVSG